MQRMAKALGLSLALGGLGAVAAWSLVDEPIPQLLVTPDVLPSLPSAQSNGWTQLNSLPENYGFEFIGDSAYPLDQISMEHLSLRERWDGLVEERDKLAATLKRPAVRRGLEAWHRASQAPKFAHDCPHPYEESCREFRYYQLHKAALAEAGGDAMAERWELAGQELAQTLQMDRRFLVSSRSLFAASVAAGCLKDSLALGRVLANEGQWDDAPELRLAIRALEESAALEDGTARERAIAGEYLRGRGYLQRVEAEGVEILTGGSRWPPAFAYDAGHTARLIDTTYAVLSSRDVGDKNGFEPADCEGIARFTNAVGCAHFAAGPATEMTQSGLEGLDEALSSASRSRAQLSERLAQVAE